MFLKRQTSKWYIYSERNIENEKQPASACTEYKPHRMYVTQGEAEQRLLRTNDVQRFPSQFSCIFSLVS